MKYLSIVLFPVVVIITMLILQVSGLSLPMRITMTTGSSADFSVIGEGKVDVVPDVGYIDVGVTVNKAASAAEAQERIADINDQLVDTLSQFDISKQDIKTTNYSVNPNYDYSGGSGRIDGYNGSAQLSIKVTKVASLGEIAKVAVEAGATDVYNTRYSIENPAQYREQARTKAINNAKEQAQKIASQLGIRLGKVTNVVESSGSTGDLPMYAERAMGLGGAGGGGGTADLQPGQQTITSVVTLYFEKK